MAMLFAPDTIDVVVHSLASHDEPSTWYECLAASRRWFRTVCPVILHTWINPDLQPRTSDVATLSLDVIITSVASRGYCSADFRFDKVVYTDGSKTADGVGLTYLILDETEAKFQFAGFYRVLSDGAVRDLREPGMCVAC